MVLVDRRKGSWALEAAGLGSEAWLPNPAATLVKGARGRSCDEACRKVRHLAHLRHLGTLFTHLAHPRGMLCGVFVPAALRSHGLASSLVLM